MISTPFAYLFPTTLQRVFSFDQEISDEFSFAKQHMRKSPSCNFLLTCCVFETGTSSVLPTKLHEFIAFANHSLHAERHNKLANDNRYTTTITTMNIIDKISGVLSSVGGSHGGSCTLTVNVVEGRNLASKDTFSKSDPYCVLSIRKKHNMSLFGSKQRTQMIKNNANPIVRI